uniref:Uncharacterized protein n=1 Tax=Arundo donax TaxID=35708 RepID=A0A0A8Z7L5_ARUDO
MSQASSPRRLVVPFTHGWRKPGQRECQIEAACGGRAMDPAGAREAAAKRPGGSKWEEEPDLRGVGEVTAADPTHRSR